MFLRRLDCERYLDPGIEGVSFGSLKVLFRLKYDLVRLTSNQVRFLLLCLA